MYVVGVISNVYLRANCFQTFHLWRNIVQYMVVNSVLWQHHRGVVDVICDHKSDNMGILPQMIFLKI